MRYFQFRSIHLLFVFLALVTWAWVKWPDLVSADYLKLKDVGERGQFGDSFGALNTLFTGYAFAGLAFSIYLQIKNEKQRQKDTKHEQVESRFFRLAEALRAIMADTVFIEADGVEFRAKDYFDKIWREVLDEEVPFGQVLGQTPIHAWLIRYERIYDRAHNDLGTYFRMLYHQVRYIDRAQLDDGKEYTDLLRAELSSAEVTLLALNCLTKRGEKFKPLVEKYQLLKHLPSDPDGPLYKAIRGSYADSAFG